MKKIVLFLLIAPFFAHGQGKVDTLSVYSEVMKKSLKIAVTTPSSYDADGEKLPVLYLLHGGSGAFDDWHKKVTQPGLLNELSEKHNLIIVTPGVGPSSYYFDSPLLDSVQYETYIIKEVIPFVEQNFSTLAQKESRAISGLSMGGHGAMTLSAKYPDLFIAAGSMSGVMNIDTRMWEVGDGLKNMRKASQKQMLGDINYEAPFSKYTAVGLVDEMKSNDLALIIDCGVDDFLISTNRQLHKLLLENETPHEYIERPGAHSWPYWTEALPVHLLFFDKYLKRD